MKTTRQMRTKSFPFPRMRMMRQSQITIQKVISQMKMLHLTLKLTVNSLMRVYHGKQWRNKLRKRIEELLLEDKEKISQLLQIREDLLMVVEEDES